MPSLGTLEGDEAVYMAVPFGLGQCPLETQSKETL